MKVLFGLRVDSMLWGFDFKKFYREKLPENIDPIFPADLSEETLIKLAPQVDILVTYKVSERFLLKAKRLKHIQVPWTGIETLDLNLLKHYPHVTVSNSHANSLAIAEHAVALLLAAAKRITYRDSHMRNGNWAPRYESRMNSFWITGKTLGVIGYGAIGKNVARILKNGFDMKIFAIKRNLTKIEKDNTCDFLGGPDDLSSVLQESDFIIVALPMTRETKGLIGKNQLSLLKESAVIGNISRGSIIDEQALFEHLKENENVTAALDVWYNYPKSRKDSTNVYQNYPFEELDNVVMSPHSAFKVVEREKFFSKDVITNILLVSEGKNPISQIDLELGY